MNHTSTSFGFRLLRRWLCSPLYEAARVQRRLDAVEQLLERPELSKQLRRRLKAFHDLERMMARVCAQGLQAVRGAVIYADIQSKRLLDFRSLLDALEQIEELAAELAQGLGCERGSRFWELSRTEKEGGVLPEGLSAWTRDLKDRVVLDGKSWRPARG